MPHPGRSTFAHGYPGVPDNGLIIAFELMSDAELACLYSALSALITRVARETIPPRSERVYGGRLSAVLAFIDDPKLRALYALGHQVHLEVERRGRVGIARHMPDRRPWHFASLGAYTWALKRALSATAAA